MEAGMITRRCRHRIGAENHRKESIQYL